MNDRNPKTSAPASPSPELINQLQTALTHQKKGEMDEASVIFKKVLKNNPDNTDVQQIVAIFYDQIEEYEQSLKLLEKVIRKKPNDFAVNRLLGKALFHTGQYELAKMRLQKTLALNIEDPEANSLFAQCLFKMGLGKAAAGFFEDSLKKRDSIIVRNKLADALLFSMKADEANTLLDDAIEKGKFDYETLILSALGHKLGTFKSYDRLINAMSLDPSRDEAKTLFTIPLTLEGAPGPTAPIFSYAVSLCLDSKNVNPDNHSILWTRQLLESPETSKFVELAKAKNYEEFKELFDQPEYKKGVLVPFFIQGTRKIRPFGILLEDIYARLRHYYLEQVTSSSTLSDADKTFLSALSSQSFSNEFVYNFTSEEKQIIGEFKVFLEKSPNDYEKLLVYACYCPLTGLKNYVDIFQNKKLSPAWLHETLDTHIGQILEERRIKKTIKTIGKINDGVSKKVKEQYEENPYPRWRGANYLMLPNLQTVDEKYRYRPNVLIAGCGTGQHIFHAYVARPDANYTAIDLSSSSLAYAMMKVKEYGLKHIKFYQADILELEQLNQKFDMIECAGVLHHMKEPEAGLKVLLKLLKPEGEITLGLYSETARKDVVKARKIIEEKGFEPTVEGIRACREYIKNNPKDFAFLINSGDFYSTSAIRDLIFHVQETRYTLPQIEEMLNSHGLKLAEFKMPNNLRDRYKSAYPDDKDCNNLKNWEEFEENNPTTFANMYQFKAVWR